MLFLDILAWIFGILSGITITVRLHELKDPLVQAAMKVGFSPLELFIWPGVTFIVSVTWLVAGVF